MTKKITKNVYTEEDDRQVKVTIDIYENKLANKINTELLCASSAYMLAIVRGWTLLILEVRGQRSRSH